MNYHTRFPAGSRPAETALVGAGAFGRSFLAQGRRMALMNARIAVDRQADIAAAAFAAVGWPDSAIAICTTPAEAAAAWNAGHAVAAARLDVVLDLPFDILVEASGHPEAGATMAMAAITAGKHVALVSKEVDSVVGPLLAARAAERGLVCTPVDGDQPSLLIDLVTWAETLGLDILAAGKSSEYDFVYDPATGRISTEAGSADVPDFDAVWTLGDRPVAEVLATRQALAKLPTVAVPDLCEMAVVANATGLDPDRAGFHAPIIRVCEVPTVFDLAAQGGILAGTRRIDVFNCLRLPHETSFAGGVFVTVRCTDAETWRVLEGKGHILSRSGNAGLVYLPRHLLGIEAPISVLNAVLHRTSSAGAVTPRVDLVARAAADFPAGHHLTMGGHHHSITGVTPELIPAGPLDGERPAPFYLLANRTLRRAVQAGAPICLADLDLSADIPLLRLRREQDALFFGGPVEDR
jgi:predicted homoserine dehydrogenase-like protein